MDFHPTKISVSELIRMKGNIKLDTKFQRGRTWGLPQRQYFMDTVRRNWHTSKIFFWKTKPRQYVCVDGQQRLRTLFDFFNDGYSLSDKVLGDFAGKKRRDLNAGQLRKIEDYKFDVVVISKASITDVADFFIRLQMGVPLNAAEKLNAILGDVRDFVREVSEHSFFKKTMSIRDHRFSHRYLAAQIALVAALGARNLKYKDLKEMYEGSLRNETQESVKRRLDFLIKTFPNNTRSIRNRATVISLYYFVDKEFESLSLEGKETTLCGFIKAFQQELDHQKQLAEEEREPELQAYMLRVVQAADTATAIEERHKILRKRFLEYERAKDE